MRKSVVGVFVNDKVEHFIYARNLERLGSRTECHFFTSLDVSATLATDIHFDVVLIDLHFSGENFGGISILKYLKTNSPKKMIAVAVTPLLQTGDVETVLDAGFSMCLEKPVAYEALQMLLHKRSN
jgi:CheY-like chemotaxis protein